LSDVFLKIIGVVLAVLLLVVAPALIVGMAQDLTIQRAAMNSTENFLDVVRNSGRITAEDYTDIVSDLHALGVMFDVHITVEQEVIYPTDVRRVTTSSLRSTQDVSGMLPVVCRKGDFVTVSVTQTSRSSGQRLAANLLRMQAGEFKFQLSGAVRN
jgi:hypothetical protein